MVSPVVKLYNKNEEACKKTQIFDFDQISLYFETKIDSIYKVLIAGAEFIDLPKKIFNPCAFLDENNSSVIKKSVSGTGQIEVLIQQKFLLI